MEYLESIKDFDELVSPQSLFLHFFGSETVYQGSEEFGSCEKEYVLFFFNIFFILLGMTTRFSKKKLAEA